MVCHFCEREFEGEAPFPFSKTMAPVPDPVLEPRLPAAVQTPAEPAELCHFLFVTDFHCFEVLLLEQKKALRI